MKKHLFLLLLMTISIYKSIAQTNLSAGDLAIVYMNTDSDDDFGFVTFTEIASGTVVYFTERGFDKVSGTLPGTEGTITWTANSTVSAGTLVKITTPRTSPGASSGTATRTNSWSLSSAGDQILAFQGTINNPTQYIYVLNLTGNITTGGVTTKSFDRSLIIGGGPGASPTGNTNVPTGLTEGVNALAFTDHKDNAQFKFVLSGAALSDFMNPDNYNRSNSTTYSGAGTETPASPTSPDISVKQSAADIASGGNYPFGSVQIGGFTDVTFTVENIGDADLDIISITLSGDGYSIQSAISADPISPSGNATFTVRFQPTVTSQGTGTVTIVSNDGDEGNYIINFNASVANATFSLTVFLEGPLSGGVMSTNLNSILPTNPNSVYASVTSETSTGIPATAVDWVEVELRTGTSAATKVGTNRGGILKSDGSIVDKDGNAFTMPQANGGGYYIVIHHRNHLSVMSNTTISPVGGTYTFDFSAAQANNYNSGSDGAIQVGTTFAMYAGDADDSGAVDGTDLTTWRSHNGVEFIYLTNGKSDLNMDGVINGLDRNEYQQKNSSPPITSQVPTT